MFIRLQLLEKDAKNSVNFKKVGPKCVPCETPRKSPKHIRGSLVTLGAPFASI